MTRKLTSLSLPSTATRRSSRPDRHKGGHHPASPYEKRKIIPDPVMPFRARVALALGWTEVKFHPVRGWIGRASPKTKLHLIPDTQTDWGFMGPIIVEQRISWEWVESAGLYRAWKPGISLSAPHPLAAVSHLLVTEAELAGRIAPEPEDPDEPEDEDEEVESI